MKEDRIYEIIGRQLSGKTSPLETQELNTWLEENENNQIIFQSLQEYWHAENTQSRNKEVVLQRLYKRMEKSQEGIIKMHKKPVTNKRLIPKYLYRVAAILLVGTCLSWLAYTNLTNQHDESTVTEMVEKMVPFGQKSTIRLSDGSTVKLNAGSKLIYPRQFGESSREVQLEGEAFFNVEKDASRPFLVKSGEIITSVLGTSFNIKAHAEENLIEVALVTGKVKVSDNASSDDQFDYTLTPNEMFTYDKERHSIEKSDFNADEVLGWKNQTLFFENAGLKEMATVLQRWYGIQFIINNGDIITRKFSGKFENNRSLEYVLNVLSLNANFTYKIVDDAVIIEGKP
ncbi:DUF4974 domain-containing protein [Fulvivirgaceae bacterium BMA10]|uniref:DUF4974 domain-containing protein n=1 Tax=Splendidivirga corallicola TaxID=3051826 RepID=A0ABT8KNA0_9BACT|nr:DUF4974 domain-containing protein [Fulvivirgaceae bacterium BMA10]